MQKIRIELKLNDNTQNVECSHILSVLFDEKKHISVAIKDPTPRDIGTAVQLMVNKYLETPEEQKI